MSNTDPNSPVWLLIIFVVILYWIPTGVAFLRQHCHRWLILLANFFAPLTILGWFALLVWSFWIFPKNETDKTT